MAYPQYFFLINGNKYTQLLFDVSKGAKKILSTYKINNENLQYIKEVKDLGMWFTIHIRKTTLRGMRMLGFTL